MLRTERVHIRRFTQADEQGLARLVSDSDVMEFSFSGRMSEKESKAYLLSAISSYEKRGYGIYALSRIGDGAFIGYSGFTYLENLGSQGEVELGYRLLPRFWGKGYATEVASALLNYGYNRLQLKRVVSLIRHDNEASIRVARKIGAVLEKRVRINGHEAEIYAYGKGV